MSDDMTNGNGNPTRIPDWGQWLADQMTAGFSRLEKQIRDSLLEPTRRIERLEKEADDLRVALSAETLNRVQWQSAAEGSIRTWRWIASISGSSGIIAFLAWLFNVHP